MTIPTEIRPPVERHPIDAWSVNAVTVVALIVGLTLTTEHHSWPAAALFALGLLVAMPQAIRNLHAGDRARRRWL